MPATLTLAALFLLPPLHATTPRWAFVEGMDNVNDGDWLRDYYDDWAPYLNGSEAPFIEGLNAMYRATGDRMFLEEAVWHADGVMDQRNDARGVTDYTNEQTPCWRDMYYTGGTPYCWVIHTGAILRPLIELAVLIQGSPYAEQPAWDGAPLSEHAQAYIDGAIETFDYHEDQWHAAGYYMIRADATFLGAEAGTPNPLNGSNLMALAALPLYDATGDERYLERATEIGARWFDNLVSTPEDGLTWSYYTDDMIDLGEDIGHASASVRLSAELWSRGILFEDVNVQRMANTLTGPIYIDDRTMGANLQGGEPNYLDYQYSIRGWLGLVPGAPEIYPVVRNLYEADAPAEETTSGGVMRAWGKMAELQPPICAAQPGDGWVEDGGWYEAAGDATLTVDASETCLVRMNLDAPGEVTVTEGGDRVAIFQPTGGERIRYLIAEGGETFALSHDGAAGPLRLEAADYAPPEITSTPPAEGDVGAPLDYAPAGEGDGPYWWAIAEAPPEARIDPATGVVEWTPSEPGLYELALRLDTDVGSVEQRWTYCVDVECPEPVDTGLDTADTAEPADTDAPADTGDTGLDADVPDADDDDPAPPADETGCGCGGSGGAPWWLAGLAAAALLSRRRRLAGAIVGLMLLDLTAQVVAPSPGPAAPGARALSAALAPTLRAADPQAVQISAGHGHSCALLDDGSVTCWGSEAHAQTTVPAGPFSQIAAGWHHTCALDGDGLVTCWGDDGNEQTDAPADAMQGIGGAYVHGVALDDIGRIQTWGAGGYQINSAPGDPDFEALACGQTHCCALDADGEMDCWGSNGLNGDPDGTWMDLAAGAVVTCGIDEDGDGTCWGNSDEYTPELDTPTPMIDVACGSRHCCGLDPDGAAFCWGDGGVAGQLDAPEGAFSQLAAGPWHTCALSTEGDVSCWGNDAAGQVSGVPTSLK